MRILPIFSVNADENSRQVFLRVSNLENQDDEAALILLYWTRNEESSS
ncbi:MAG: hypothetical protein LBS77_06250 [Desulfovibrio sp.]|nr:hypothetical protein [Desulfovibrio sp.]